MCVQTHTYTVYITSLPVGKSPQTVKPVVQKIPAVFTTNVSVCKSPLSPANVFDQKKKEPTITRCSLPKLTFNFAQTNVLAVTSVELRPLCLCAVMRFHLATGSTHTAGTQTQYSNDRKSLSNNPNQPLRSTRCSASGSHPT